MRKRVILTAAILGCCILSAGCPPGQTACERAMAHLAACAPADAGVPDQFSALLCAFIPDDCDLTAWADCITALSCEELLAAGWDVCTDELDDEDCMGGFLGDF